MISKVMETPSIKDMKQKMPLLMVKSIKSMLLNLTYLIDVNMETVVILNKNLLNIEVIVFLFQLKFFVLSNVIISKQVTITKKQHLDFFENEKRRSIIMTMDRIQPYYRANNNNLGYFDRIGIFPRLSTDRNKALYLYNNHFCLIWKSEWYFSF